MTGDAWGAVVVVNYGSCDLVEANFAPLGPAVDGIVRDIVVVDSFSSDAERERVRDMCERRGWTAVLLDENEGFGRGVNRGAAVALERGASRFVVVNPDALIAPSSVERLFRATIDRPLDLVAPLITRPDGSVWTEGVDLYLDDGTMAGVRFRDRHEGRPRRFWISGACFAVSAELWRAVGGFDDDYFLYWEDVDLSQRVVEAGGGLAVLQDATAVHDEGGTHEDRSGGRAKSATYYYYNIRNRLIYASKHLTAEQQAQWRRTSPRVAYAVLLQGGRRQLVTGTAAWRALWRGLRDARKGRSGPLAR